MTAAFLGRARELDYLESEYQRPGSNMIPIYGRRRVGKTSLIWQFLKAKPHVYVVGSHASVEHHLREFLSALAAACDEPLFRELQMDSWKAALELAVERWPHQEKLVIALDEFQWLVGAEKALPSFLQLLWDSDWQKRTKSSVMIILCGSFIGFMEREVLGKRSPLFGRRTGQIKLEKMSYHDAALFHPNLSLRAQAETYFICGGIPWYHQQFLAGRSTAQNITEALLGEFSPLAREADSLLHEELGEVPNYYSILTAVGEGCKRVVDIAKRAGIERGALAYYLNQLCELGYLEKRYPLSRKPPSARTVRYAISDVLLAFWFRFVFPQLSAMRENPKRAFAQTIRPHLESYFGSCFERMCREFLRQYYIAETTTSFRVGEYWDKNVQIDVIGQRDDAWTDLGECKWGRVRSLKQLANELESKVGVFPNEANDTIGRLLFTAHGGAGQAPDGYQIFTLEDLYVRE